ncbi:GTPase-activating protein skywalker isoform X2 [Frankliniella occidentalis]|uniref:GTPase-activating protein skywalker isoform X2 n=1 Tax=Frankliniella occidentalis TaxID=133901 RepID=A0A6J1TIC3_FRAOC|nr:GTPase-activating protein skywalker isoform X2 [Frankliniella occidentalis]
MAVMLSTLEEESDMYEVFPAHVDTSSIPIVPDSPAKKNAKPLKTWSEINSLIQAGRKREVKLILREQGWPTNHTIRAQLWPALCKQHSSSRPMQDGFYWELVNQLFGTTDISDKPMLLPAFVENTHCLPYHLTRRGRSLADRVVCVLGFSCPDITYSPALYPIAALLLHFMPEEECYNSLASLISSKDKTFITQTKLLYEATWRTVMLITKKHMKSAAAHLARHCSDARSERIYADWLWWILQGLPLTHLVRVMDCFFHEGIKVLYRVAMAILFLFYKYSTSQSSEWSAELAAQGVDNALTKFCRQMPVSPTKVLRTAFNVRGLSSSYIQRVFVKTEMLLKSKPVLSNSQQISRSRSSENLPTSQSQNNIQLVSHTLTIRELFTLWSWLPVRITMYQPILLYTTEEHGCSLTTFYVRVEQHEPTLLMIKTSNNEVFGAYCSTRWYERNVKDDRGNRQAYFGTGETFLFSLYPERAKYPWVGMEQSPGEKQLDHSAELFLAADHKMITIGGGEGQAIWMDENIRYGKTDRCLTFNNPPLCPSGDFEIRVLEVYGFAGA